MSGGENESPEDEDSSFIVFGLGTAFLIVLIVVFGIVGVLILILLIVISQQHR